MELVSYGNIVKAKHTVFTDDFHVSNKRKKGFTLKTILKYC